VVAATAEQATERGVLEEIAEPWGPQRDFICSGALFRRYQGGQGSGKTVAGCFDVRRFAKRHPGAIVIATEPTYPMVRDILRVEFDRQFAATKLLSGPPGAETEADVTRFVKSEHKYVLPNGSEIWLRQCDKFDALRGPSCAAVWMDEAAQSPHKAFQVLVGRMRQRGYPHMFLCTGTPRGRNWLHWTFTEGERRPSAPAYIGDMLTDLNPEELQHATGPLVESFFACSLDNPYLDPITRAGLQAAYSPGTPLYRQEVRGETTVFEGLVYSEFDELRHVDEPPPPREFVRFVGGQDWNYAQPGAFLVLGLHESGVVWVLEESYQAKRPVQRSPRKPDEESWVGVAEELTARWGIDTIACDPSEPEFIRVYRDEGLHAVRANNQVTAGITQVGGLIQRGQLMIAPGCVATLGEIASYAWKASRDDLQSDQPNKVDDHAMDALRYGAMELRGGAREPQEVAAPQMAKPGSARRQAGRRRR